CELLANDNSLVYVSMTFKPEMCQKFTKRFINNMMMIEEPDILPVMTGFAIRKSLPNLTEAINVRTDFLRIVPYHSLHKSLEKFEDSSRTYLHPLPRDQGIRMQDLFIAFILYGIGLKISFFAFITEAWYFKKQIAQLHHVQ